MREDTECVVMFKKKKRDEMVKAEMTSQSSLMQSQIRRMVEFMELEGVDRAMQLDERAEEEYHMTKGQIINHQRRIIAVQYEKRLAKLQSDSNTEVSKMRNQGRLKAFKAKAVMVDEIVNEIRDTVVKELESDKALYLPFLENLYLQALCMLMKDGKVLVTVRKKDLGLCRTILSSVASEFERLTGKTVLPEIEANSFLKDDSLGGAMFRSGRVFVSSTLSQRIEDVVYRAMPFIRSSLFGVNTRRKFFI